MNTAWSLNEIFKNPAIWFILIVGISYSMTIGLIVTHGVLHFTDKGFTQMQAATILSSLIFASGVARLIIGWIGDRIELRWIVLTAMIFLFFMFLGIWIAPSMGLMMIIAPVYGFCFGAQWLSYLS